MAGRLCWGCSVLTWEGRAEAVRGPAGGDASDHAVKEEADPLAFGTGQEEHASPWRGGGGDGEGVRKHKNSRGKNITRSDIDFFCFF